MKKYGLVLFFWLLVALCTGYLFYVEYYVEGKRISASAQEMAYAISLFISFVVLVGVLLKKGVHPTLIKLVVLLLSGALMLTISVFTE